jgi:hypothetical protein
MLCLIQHMRCVVHTLQLAIRDGLKERHAATLIGKLRQVGIAAGPPKLMQSSRDVQEKELFWVKQLAGPAHT